MLKKFQEFVQFCFDHGDTLKHHRAFGEMGVDLHEMIRKFEEFHPRAFKLMQKQKPFIVIANDEPYYLEAYSLIRYEEIKKGTWSEEDERIFRVQCEQQKDALVCSCGCKALMHVFVCDDCGSIIVPWRSERNRR